MFVLAFLVAVSLVHAEIASQGEVSEKSRMVGVDTIHEVKVNKDTVITRNAVLPKKGPTKAAVHHHKNEASKEDRDPDWSYSSFPNEVSAHVQLFKKNMTECLKEVQAKDKRRTRRLSPKMESPIHGECLIACVLKRNGVIEAGKINKINLITLVGKFYAKDTKLMKKLEKNVDRCIESSIRIVDECLLASHLNDCTNELMANNKHKIVVNY